MRTLQVNNAIAIFKQQERPANTSNILEELKEHDDGRAIGTMAKEAQRFEVPDCVVLKQTKIREVILEWSKAARLNSDEVMAHIGKRLRLVQMGQIIMSAASYSLGITAWKRFVVKLFGYDPEYALPPLCSRRVKGFYLQPSDVMEQRQAMLPTSGGHASQGLRVWHGIPQQ